MPSIVRLRIGPKTSGWIRSRSRSSAICSLCDKARNGAPFLALSHKEQIALLRDLERIEPDVFRPIRDLTMLGMFSHPVHGGNYQKIGWKLIGYVDQYSWAPPFGYYDRGQA